MRNIHHLVFSEKMLGICSTYRRCLGLRAKKKRRAFNESCWMELTFLVPGSHMCAQVFCGFPPFRKSNAREQSTKLCGNAFLRCARGEKPASRCRLARRTKQKLKKAIWLRHEKISFHFHFFMLMQTREPRRFIANCLELEFDCKCKLLFFRCLGFMDLLRKGQGEGENIKSHLHSLHKLLEFAENNRFESRHKSNFACTRGSEVFCGSRWPPNAKAWPLKPLAETLKDYHRCSSSAENLKFHPRNYLFWLLLSPVNKIKHRGMSAKREKIWNEIQFREGFFLNAICVFDRLFQSQKQFLLVSEIDSWKISTNSAPWWGLCLKTTTNCSLLHLIIFESSATVISALSYSFREAGDNRRSESFFICLRNAHRVSSDVSHCARVALSSQLVSNCPPERKAVASARSSSFLCFISSQRTMRFSLFHSTEPRKCQPNSSLNVAVHGKRDIARETKTALAWKFPQEWFTRAVSF